jgi:hypothetical protein
VICVNNPLKILCDCNLLDCNINMKLQNPTEVEDGRFKTQRFAERQEEIPRNSRNILKAEEPCKKTK